MPAMTQIFPYILAIAILSLLALILALIAYLKHKSLADKMTVLFSGKEAKDLEKIILEQGKEIKALDKEIQELFEISNTINNLAYRGLHKVGILRFNPFKDIGGDQSFAIALLDGRSNGLVLSSLHTREGTRVYAKPIIKGESDRYTLTEEEKIAISSAISQKEAPRDKKV